MSKVRVRSTPSEAPAAPTATEAVMSSAAQTKEATDGLGRKIVVRKVGPLIRMKMFEIIGAAASQNQHYCGIAVTAFSVLSIDGRAIPMPTNKMQLEALIQELGDDGVGVVQSASMELNGLEIDAEGNLKMNGRTIADAKKLQGMLSS